jgi:hypothetical protein
VDLKPVVPKTIDTLHLMLNEQRKQRGGISLNDLCEINGIGIKKKLKNAVEVEVKRRGGFQRVAKYNRWDCELTFRLWLLATRQTYLRTSFRLSIFNEATYSQLTGHSPQLNYKQWLALLKEEERATKDGKKRYPIRHKENKTFRERGFKKKQDWFSCRDCKSAYRVEYQTEVSGQVFRFEDVVCVKCGKTLGKVPADREIEVGFVAIWAPAVPNEIKDQFSAADLAASENRHYCFGAQPEKLWSVGIGFKLGYERSPVSTQPKDALRHEVYRSPFFSDGLHYLKVLPSKEFDTSFPGRVFEVFYDPLVKFPMICVPERVAANKLGCVIELSRACVLINLCVSGTAKILGRGRKCYGAKFLRNKFIADVLSFNFIFHEFSNYFVKTFAGAKTPEKVALDEGWQLLVLYTGDAPGISSKKLKTLLGSIKCEEFKRLKIDLKSFLKSLPIF